MTALVPGDILDNKYRVLRPIGEGGMGTVYEGEHVRIARRVAIKVMHAAMASERDLVERFEREAQAAAKIGSSYVVDVLDLGELPSGEQYMVMEFLEGESLATRLRGCGAMAPTEVCAIAIQLLDGLAKVHGAGIIHRDLKPGNIFLAKADDGSDFVKLLDFGICKFTQRLSIEPAGSDRLLGTLGYMSPEVMAGQIADARSDIYSVGVVLFRCTAGVLPYSATNPLDLIMQIQGGSSARLDRLVPGIDERFAAIVTQAISAHPSTRFRDAREMRDALASWLSELGRVDRLLAGFLEVDYVEQRRRPAVPPRTRNDSERVEGPTLDIAQVRKNSDVNPLMKPATSGMYSVHVEYNDDGERSSPPIDEVTTRRHHRSAVSESGSHPKHGAPREARAAPREDESRAAGFSRRELPTTPRRPRR